MATELNIEMGSGNSMSLEMDSQTNVFDLNARDTLTGIGMVFSNTTAVWNSKPRLKTIKNALYIYTDGLQKEDGTFVPRCKIGDGNAYLIDMPYNDDIYYDHVNNPFIHISPPERTIWNNKVSCEINPEDQTNLIFKY